MYEHTPIVSCKLCALLWGSGARNHRPGGGQSIWARRGWWGFALGGLAQVGTEAELGRKVAPIDGPEKGGTFSGDTALLGVRMTGKEFLFTENAPRSSGSEGSDSGVW